MKVLINISAALVCLIVGYLIGSISNSIIIGRLVYHQDPRDAGSRNAGGTNAGRLWGRKMGFFIIALDMIKVILPLWLMWSLLTFIKFDGTALMPSGMEFVNGEIADYTIPWPVYWLSILGTVVGHCYPVYYGFRGGKGVSSFYGVLIGGCWVNFVVTGVTFMITIGAKHYVSLASVVSSIVGTIFSWVWAILIECGVFSSHPTLMFIPTYGTTLYCNYVLAICLTIMMVILIVKHIPNMKRIRKGEENKITWLKER
ncbi:MAG: glycerol-3-phosphate 1-O-acyltransferase PlsY [Coprobacillus sp.]|nr:glycerol-3-phosphate 1-O-acyltransferase PlsY [Coprobacillus sp.]